MPFNLFMLQKNHLKNNLHWLVMSRDFRYLKTILTNYWCYQEKLKVFWNDESSTCFNYSRVLNTVKNWQKFQSINGIPEDSCGQVWKIKYGFFFWHFEKVRGVFYLIQKTFRNEYLPTFLTHAQFGGKTI